MLRINRVYTGTGDRGQTSLINGERVFKDDERVEVYGTIDELLSVLGFCRTTPSASALKLDPLLEFLQQELFDLGSQVATPVGYNFPGQSLVKEEAIARLELYCDMFGQGMPELTSFILPGGSQLASQLHIARTVARRAERRLISLRRRIGDESYLILPLIYLNRVSDLLFVLSRWVMHREGVKEVLWTKGLDRDVIRLEKLVMTITNPKGRI
ncbi:MAG: cob(I)yrinic acid a,c-diamide adenosyltransferase [bacterium]|nr:cob(I)yrinic acid a,c-diamide adenosyltransferase [bacterium]